MVRHCGSALVCVDPASPILRGFRGMGGLRGMGGGLAVDGSTYVYAFMRSVRSSGNWAGGVVLGAGDQVGRR